MLRAIFTLPAGHQARHFTLRLLHGYTGSQLPVALLFIGSGVLGLAIVYGIMRNRRRTQSEKTKTEQATRELYRAEDRDRRAS